MVVVDAYFDDESAFLMQEDDFILRSAAGGLLQLRLEVFYEDLDLLRVDGDDVVVAL